MNYFLNNPIPTAAQMMKKYARGGEVVKGYARGGEFDGSIYDLAESYGIPVEYLIESIQPTYQEEPVVSDEWGAGVEYDQSAIPSGFDWQYYLQKNPDLPAAGLDTPEEAMRHFAMYGRNEGRSFAPQSFSGEWGAGMEYDQSAIPKNFDWRQYLSRNYDLPEAGLDTEAEARRHYALYGRNEGRPISWEAQPATETTMPTGEEEKLTGPAGAQESPLSYTVPGATLPVDVSSMDFDAGQKAMALMSLVDPAALSAMNFQVGDAAFGGGAPSTFRADTRAGLGSAGSFYGEGALEAFKEAAKDPTQGIFKSGFEALAGEPGIAEAIAAKTERDLGALAKVEADYAVMKPLSDLLKANKFQEAFAFAKENNAVDKLMDTRTLQELRPAFSPQEMRDFFAAVPPDYAGGNFDFKPDIGVLESMDPYGTGTLMESGYPDPTRAFKRKDDKTIENLAKIAAVAMLAAGVAPLFTAGAASTGTGALGSLQAAGKALLALPETIGIQVGNALGASTLSTMQAKMIGNAIISGGVTGAKGGDLGDILKSAAMAAGLTFVSDKAIKAVTGALKNSGVIDAVKDIPGGDVAAVDPTVASNVANNVAQGLREFTVTTFAPGAAAAGLANVGAIAGGQAAAAPEDQIAREITVSTEAPRFGAGLETGAYTGYELASDQGVEEPAVTEQTEVVEEPVEEIKVSTEADQLDFSDPFIQSLIDQYTPEVTQPVEPVAETPIEEIKVSTGADQVDFSDPFIQSLIDKYTPEVTQPVEPVAEAPLEEIKVSTEADQLDLSDPFLQSLIDKYTPEVTQPDLEEVKVSTSPDELEVSDASDAVIQTVMDQFEPAPIDPETGMAEIEVSTGNLDLTDPLTQVLTNRFDVETPEPVTDDIEEFKVETERELPDEDLNIPPPTPIVVDPADILKDYKPVGVEEDPFKELLKKYGTLENLIEGLGLLGGTSKTTPPPAAGAPYDPRASATAGQWIDWEKVKADAAAAGMNLNTYVARNWNKIQNRALEAGMQPYTPSPAMVNPASLPSTPSQSADLNSSRDRFYRDMIAGGLSPEAAEKETAARYGSLNPAMVNPNSLPGGGGMTFARGGALNRVAGPGSGRDDKIPALLSDGEYVIDAETMALLGDGSVDKAAELMDEFRENIRKHKGATLAKGGISPNAKSPLQYLRGI